MPATTERILSGRGLDNVRHHGNDEASVLRRVNEILI